VQRERERDETILCSCRHRDDATARWRLRLTKTLTGGRSCGSCRLGQHSSCRSKMKHHFHRPRQRPGPSYFSTLHMTADLHPMEAKPCIFFSHRPA
jgi:hypothetical protein